MENVSGGRKTLHGEKARRELLKLHLLDIRFSNFAQGRTPMKLRYSGLIQIFSNLQEKCLKVASLGTLMFPADKPA